MQTHFVMKFVLLKCQILALRFRIRILRPFQNKKLLSFQKPVLLQSFFVHSWVVLLKRLSLVNKVLCRFYGI